MSVADPLVSVDWLVTHLADENIRVLDATWVAPFLTGRRSGAEAYTAGHIPGAAYFDIDLIADQSSRLSHMLPSPEQFAAQVGKLGINSQSVIVVYDSNGFFASARAWWMFRAMGHEAVWVLDGGFQAWQAAGGQIETSTASIKTTDYRPLPRSEMVRDMAAMRAHVRAQDVTILDARDTGRFSGAAPEPRPDLPSGHMPGSVCVPASSLITEDGRLKSPTELEPLLSAHVDSLVVTTCGSGVSAAIISLALARLGNFEAALYDGSWSQWAAHPENPIELIS